MNTKLDQCCHSFEEVFSKAAEIAKLMGNKECCKLSANRALSYNPTNAKIKTMNPYLSNIATTVSVIMNTRFQIVKENGNLYQNWITLGHCYLILGDFPNAYASYAYSFELHPENNDPLLAYAYGVIFQHFGYVQRSLQSWSNIPSNGSIYFEPDLRFRQAISFRNNQQFDEALRLFNKVSEKPPTTLTADDVLFQIAYTHQIRGDRELAKTIYFSLLKKHPNSIPLHQQYAWFAYRYLDCQDAEAIIDSTLQRYPQDPIINVIGGLFSMLINKTDRAYNLYKSSHPYTVENAGFWCALGELYYKNEQLKDSQSSFKRALQICYDIPEAWLNVGFIAEQQNNIEEAITLYQSGLEYTGSPLLNEAANNVKNGRKGVTQLAKLNEERIFIDIPKQFANEYGSCPPFIQGSDIGANIDVTPLYIFPKSPLEDSA
ncbi:TPR Domain containing protein [Trichomonas vaginalis G3]|uniref:TPR Domain containing protein n=1 Tax=Trichomonas vaginalis (strain ATCC PRA-98 / G3) TaxID=412133 RepID=A2DZB0_TRIV3|nr:cellular component assembly [Trichomonas vaginalis G3]EAY14239.1 TPR Domain containing protein [Trichomonas vaginalis G3]KAI5491903.1 cellular component assembly [Trichomonas vaginalis G3]|eukprot:XP_001326462.1 TPR Domain containing protein [Trichomonas vaginalis G3]